MNNPEYAKVGDKKYKINTDYRIAIECDKIGKDNSIDDYERCLAIIYKLYGDEGLYNPQDHQKLLEIAQKYLKCGKESNGSTNGEPDMDYNQDFSLIHASFMVDYRIDLKKEKMHFWDFMSLLNGLTDKCVLSRVREIRNMDLSDIKDQKYKNDIIKLKKQFALKKENATRQFTSEELENMRRWAEQEKG